MNRNSVALGVFEMGDVSVLTHREGSIANLISSRPTPTGLEIPVKKVLAVHRSVLGDPKLCDQSVASAFKRTSCERTANVG